jgi:RNA polymerase sigma-54 factor
MKQSLQLRIGQSLTMTPQLQQAIRLLQLSTLELQNEIQQTLDSNPMLEQDDGTGVEAAEPETAGKNSETTITAEGTADSIPDELPVDSSWDDVFDTGATSFSTPEANSRDLLDTVTVSGPSLHDHLAWQVGLTNLSDKDRYIALTVIDSIDDDGYLSVATDDLLRSMEPGVEIEPDEIDAVIHRIQQLDPVGVGARDLRECLLLQLQQYDPATPWYGEARALLRHYFTLLSNRDYAPS